MPKKGKLPKSNRCVLPKNSTNQGETNSEIKLSNVPMINSVPMLSRRVEQMTAKTNKTSSPIPKNQNIKKKGNVYSEAIGKSITTTSNNISPKLCRTTDMKSTTNFIYNRKRISLDSPITQVTCRPTTPRFLDTQLKNTLFTTQQVRRYLDECASAIDLSENFKPLEGDLPSHIKERNKLNAFNITQNQLREMQSQFIRRCENRTDNKTTKMKRSYTFISLVENNNCRLVLDDECLSRLPKNLPLDSLKILKDSVMEGFDNSLDFLTNQIKYFKIPENQINLRANTKLIFGKFIEHQEYETEILMKRIDVLFKHPTNNNPELIRTCNEYLGIEKAIADLKSRETKKELALIAEHKSELANEIKSREETIAKLTKINKNYEKKLNENRLVLTKENEIFTSNEKEIHNLHEEIGQLKNSIRDLKIDKPKMNEYDQFLTKEITQLKKEIEMCSHLIDDLKTELAQKKSLPKLPTRSSDIKFLKRKFEAAQYNLIFLKEQNKKSNEFVKIYSQLVKVLRENETELHDELKTLENDHSKNILFISKETRLENSYQGKCVETLQNMIQRNNKRLIRMDKNIAQLDKEIAQLKLEFKNKYRIQPVKLTRKDIMDINQLDANSKHSKEKRSG